MEEKNEKLFTQADVDRIVQDRLARTKYDREKEIEHVKAESEAAVNAKIAEISEAATRKKCLDYLTDNKYPAEYADLIDCTDFESFSNKAETIYKATAKNVTTSDPKVKELTRKLVAYEYGLPEELHGRLVGETEEDLRKDAEKLSLLFKRSEITAPLGSNESLFNGPLPFSREATKHKPRKV